MKHAERFNLDVPDDFPLDEIEAIHAHVSDRDEAARSPEWHEWAAALNGLLYRFKACDEHATAVIASLGQSNSPAIDERYRQEKWLFAFFMEGVSAIECLYYGLYFIGALAAPDKFDAEIERKRVKTEYVAARFADAFPSKLSTKLTEIHSGAELKLWRDVRNVLTHRGAPPRHFLSGGPSETLWGLSEAASRLLDPEELTQRRERVGAAVAAIAEAAVPFVEANVP